MLIRLNDIPDEGLDLHYKESPERLSLKDYIAEEIVVDAHIVKDAEAISVAGDIKAILMLECSRCLKRFTITINPHFAVDYVPIPEYTEDAEVELKGADMEVGFYRGDTLELDELINEQIVLSIPMKSLCSQSCKGICPVCAQDMNIKECGCREKKINPQFEVLKKLLKKG